MKPLCASLVVGLVLLTTSCMPRPKDKLVGRWRAEDRSETIEYHSDGRLTGTGPSGPVDLKWKMLGSKYIEWSKFDEEKKSEVRVARIKIKGLGGDRLLVASPYTGQERLYFRVD